MFEVYTKKSVKLGATFVSVIGDDEVEITWSAHQLMADGEGRRILGMWIEDDARIFCCMGTPECESPGKCEYCLEPTPIPAQEKGEADEHFACRKTEAIISHHGLDPVAVSGFHQSPYGNIPCRKGNSKVDTSRYSWSGNYEKTEAAKV
jgi:hypothetical protein